MTKTTKKKLSSAEKCLAIVKDLTVFSDGKNYYALLKEEGTRQVVARLPSQEFEEWLSRKYTKAYTAFINSSDIRGIVNFLRAKAKQSGEVREVFMRFAQNSSGSSFIDLCNRKDDKVIAIDDQGWTITKQTDVVFTTDTHLCPLVEPDRAANEFEALKLFKYINVKDKMNQVAILAWICSLPLNMEHPILMLQGKKASGKTTAAKSIRKIYDNAKPINMSLVSNESDVALNFFKNPVCFIDNMDKITPSMANMFCKAVTGDGYSKRIHYTNTQLIHFEYERPVVITALHPPTLRGDFLSRCMWVKMREINSNKFIGKDLLKEEFAADTPSIFGALLTLTVRARQEAKSIRLNHKTRLVDFDLFACGVAKALGVDPCKFMQSRLAAADQLSCYGKEKPFFDSFIDLIDSKNGTMNIAAQKLADEISDKLGEPLSVHSLGKKFSHHTTVLDDLNISVNKKRGKSGVNYEISQFKPKTSELVSFPKHCCECVHYEGSALEGSEHCKLFAVDISPDPRGVKCTEYIFAEDEWEYEELYDESDVEQDDLPDMMELYGTPAEEQAIVDDTLNIADNGYQPVFSTEE